MTPYYQREGVTLYAGDARVVLASLPSRSFDLLLTDPPYGVNWQSGHRERRFRRLSGDESTDVARAVLERSLRLLRPYRHWYAFGRIPVDGIPSTKPVELVWDKGQPSGGDVTLPWAPEHEYIQFGVFIPSASNVRKGYGALAARLRQGSVIQCQRVNGVAVTRHPTEKPVRLLRQLIESSSVLGETVLDPFIGVGSTAVAAVLEGRGCVGIELDAGYLEIAARRVDAALDAVKALGNL